jgi:hypothetical protein
VQGVGDVDGNGVLADNDVSCAFDVYLADQSVSPGCNYQNTACEVDASDVDCSGRVTPEDARAIEIRRAAGLAPGACFATASPAPSAAPYDIALIQSVINDGGTPRLRVSIALQDAADLDAFGARVAFPAAQVSFQRAEAAFATEGWHSVGGRAAGAGEARVGGFDAYAPLAAGPREVCHLYFDFLGAPGTVGGLSLADLVDDFTGAHLVSTVTGVGGPVPAATRLHPNHPNPFNPATEIAYEIGGSDASMVPVRIAVYDVAGRRVRVLVDRNLRPGSYTARWDGRTDAGEPAASGVYFCSLRAGSVRASQRMVLLK